MGSGEVSQAAADRFRQLGDDFGISNMGSPLSELWRGEDTEVPTAVTLTHSFEIAQYELTWQAWSEVGPVVPSKPAAVIEDPTTCMAPNCPLRYATWFEALGFANLLSGLHDPTLAPCFDLTGCTGDIGTGMTCSGVSLTAASVYECEGYRLPTEAEWEYATRGDANRLLLGRYQHQRSRALALRL